MACCSERGLDLADRQLSEVEDTRRQHGVSTGIDSRCEVLEATSSPAGDDWHPDLGAHGPDQREVIAILRAVGIHGVEQNLAGTELCGSHRPSDRVDSC